MLDNLMNAICDELERYDEKGGSLSMGDLERIGKLLDAKKDLMELNEMEGGMSHRSYSRGGDWQAEGRMGGSYADGYSTRARHYVRPHYSYADGMSMLVDEIKERMNGADAREREKLERAMKALQG